MTPGYPAEPDFVSAEHAALEDRPVADRPPDGEPDAPGVAARGPEPDRDRARLRAARDVQRAAVNLAVIDQVDAVVGLCHLQSKAGVKRLAAQRHDVGELPQVAAGGGPVSARPQLSQFVARKAARPAEHEVPV